MADFIDCGHYEVVDMSNAIRQMLPLAARPTPHRSPPTKVDPPALTQTEPTFPRYITSTEPRVSFSKGSSPQVILMDNDTMSEEERDYVRYAGRRMSIAATRYRHQVYLAIVENDRMKDIRVRAETHLKNRANSHR